MATCSSAIATDPIGGNHLCQRMIKGFERRVGISLEEQQAHRTAPSIGRPAPIVHDLQDREVPWAEGERWARHWPSARLLSTLGWGDSGILEADEVIAAGMCFLNGGTVGERIVSTPNLPYGLA